MKITYNSPNRSHHYPYAEALHRAGKLYAFVTSFSRFSPRSSLPSIGSKLKRYDFVKNFHIAGIKLHAPESVISLIDRLTGLYLDHGSYSFAKESDVFIYYRTEGLNTTLRLHKDHSPTICVMEEVNSHVEIAEALMQDEYERIGFKKPFKKVHDYDLRLKTYDETDYILCPSEFVIRSFIKKGFSRDRLIKVNLGFPSIENMPNESVKEKDDTFRLLYVGQINYRKGLRYAIEAFKKLRHPKKEFIIVGPKTPITGLENTIIPARVIFTGPLKGEDLKAQYRRASVFVLPSIEDGFGLVVGEALSYGVPVIITLNTGASDVIVNGREGFIVPIGDPIAIEKRLQEMADQKHLLDSMSFAALQAAAALGSWDIAANSLITSLTEILNSKSKTKNHSIIRPALNDYSTNN